MGFEEGECVKERKRLLNSLTEEIREILNGKLGRDRKLQDICRLLKENISYYDWVGFYLIPRKARNELLLGPFEGESTEHVRVLFGEGICGQAAKLRKTVVVQDVSKEMDYLSCSPNVKSEIVVPIFKNGEVVGELDIDSHSLSPFTDEDKAFLEKICKMMSGLL